MTHAEAIMQENIKKTKDANTAVKLSQELSKTSPDTHVLLRPGLVFSEYYLFYGISSALKKEQKLAERTNSTSSMNSLI